jgi:hypothetical protein
MPGRGSIISSAKAIRQQQAPSSSPQGLGNGYIGSVSPMARSLDTGGNQDASWTNAYRAYLPRPADDFLNGAFGPFSPILPVPVDAPEPGSDFPDPRLWEYEVGWNLPTGRPGSEGIKLADFETLRTLADLYSVARACIQLRKNEIRGIDWDIAPTVDAAKAMRGSHSAMKDFGARRAEAMQFFQRGPDPDYFSWDSFIDAFLEEIFVFDAASLLFRSKFDKSSKKGLLGSNLDCLNLINGPTIRPLLDMHGAKPRPPAPAYQQYLYGVPRSDFMTLLSERDITSGGLSGAEVNAWHANQLLYLPMVPRRWTPYGFPPIERALIPVMSGLQKQGYQLDYFREGTVPAVYISPGGVNSNMTPNQIRELQDALNAIAGDPAWKHKIIVLPADSKVMPQREQQLADAFDEVVMNQVCVVPGTEILTKRGLVKIEDIALGDEVLTHKGRWRPVLAKFKNQRNGREMRKLTAKGLDSLELTTDHKVWSAGHGQTVSHKSFSKETGWVQAGQLKAKRTRGDFDTLTVPVPEFGPEDAKLDVYQWVTRELTPRTKRLPDYLLMDKALGRLLGYYMAEGCVTPNQVTWSFHEKETEYHQQVEKDLLDVFGLAATTAPRTGSHVTDVRACSVLLAELFSCGTALVKVLPAWAWDGSKEFFEGLLEGWINGDGCKTLTGFRGYTASKSLAWQMRLIALMLGHEATIRTQKQPESFIDGRKIGGQGFIHVLGWVSDKQRSSAFKLEDGLVSTALRANEISDYEEDVVWDLNVQEDHSYLTTGGLLSNCMAFDVQPMELGIMPKVSTTTSPGAAHQMAKMSQDVQARKATKPTLTFIADIMDYILQVVCKQEDMRFVFAGTQEEKDEETLTNLLVQQVGAGMRSIDEARAELKLQPWGLPETSDPGWATQAGWFPLQEAVEAMRTGNLQGPQLALPSGAAPAAGLPEAGPQPVVPGVPPAGTAAKPAPAAPGAAKPAAKPAAGAKPAQKPAAAAKPASGAAKPAAKPASGAKPASRTSQSAPTPGHDVASANNRRSRAAKSAQDDGYERAVHAEFEALARHVKKGRLLTSWEPRHIEKSVLARISENMAKGVDVDTAIKVAQQMRRVMENGQEFWVDEDPEDPEFWTNPAGGGGFTKFPHDAEGIQTAKSEVHIPIHPSVSSEVVFQQMLKNFPPESLTWVKKARWAGPITLGHEFINLSDESSWAAEHEQQKVDSFMERIQEGDLPKPSIAILEPGDTKVQIIDGHHRALAYMNLGMPVRMYVGRVNHHNGPWNETHSSQVHQGADPANKAEKVSKESVNYRRSTEPGRSCGTCSMFRDPHSCTLVAGTILHIDVCDEWEPRLPVVG